MCEGAVSKSERVPSRKKQLLKKLISFMATLLDFSHAIVRDSLSSPGERNLRFPLKSEKEIKLLLLNPFPQFPTSPFPPLKIRPLAPISGESEVFLALGEGAPSFPPSHICTAASLLFPTFGAIFPPGEEKVLSKGELRSGS